MTKPEQQKPEPARIETSVDDPMPALVPVIGALTVVVPAIELHHATVDDSQT